jgi:acetyltransferase-like isoleucine patch superfamily enzyme
LILVSPPFLKKALLQWFCDAHIGRRAQIGWFSAVMGRHVVLGDHSAIRPFTLVKLAGDLKLGDYSEISSFTLIYGTSSVVVGDNSYLGPQSLINADEPVRVGHGSALGPRSMVFTHGSFLPYTEGYWSKLAGVTIGDKVWCAAGVFLHPGVEIGEDSFVNSRSVVTATVPPGSIVEGNPAQVVGQMERLKRKMSPRRVDAAMAHVLQSFAEVGLRRELGIDVVDESSHRLRFSWRGTEYCISLIPSTGPAPEPPSAQARQIYLVNAADWSPPAGAMVYDLGAMHTRFTSDGIHTALRRYMLRYYGMRFRDEDL